MKNISKSITRIVFALILAASMIAFSAPASADPGTGVTPTDPTQPLSPLGATWED